MQDLPPKVSTFFSGDGTATGADPDTRTPAAFLWWVLGRQWPVIVWSSVSCLLWFLPMTLGPWILGRARQSTTASSAGPPTPCCCGPG